MERLAQLAVTGDRITIYLTTAITQAQKKAENTVPKYADVPR